MVDLALDDLADHLDWLEATLRLRHPQTENHEALVQRIADARGRIDARETEDDWRSRLALSTAESHVVYLLAAVALEPNVRNLLRTVEQFESWDPTLDALRRVVYGARPSASALRDLAPDGPLRRLGLIERSDGGSSDMHESRWTWAISRRMLALLHGDVAIDPTLVGIRHAEVDQPALDSLAVTTAAVSQVRDALATPDAAIVVSGATGLGRRTLIRAAAREAGIEVLDIDASRISKEPVRQLRAIHRECMLANRVPLLSNLTAEIAALVATELPGRVFATTPIARPPLRWDRPIVAIELDRPTGAQRAKLWGDALERVSDADKTFLSERYPLAPALLVRAARAARALTNGKALGQEDVFAGVRIVLDDRLGELAQRRSITQTWDDLVLPADQIDPIEELIARVRARATVYEAWGFGDKVGKGLGVTALFSGPPGTGKTMVASLIAKELGLELYQVDLSRMVSKWLGETEKQLGALFDAAEAGHAVLLFDEADALFGKRSEVKSSNDRYANLETNYLLQRLESFTGICLLTSNHETNIDPAFQRRLSLHVRFELPDENERTRLWRAMLPAAAPVEQIDFRALGRKYDMSGGYIRNAVLRAAFRAADARELITTTHLDHAARIEYEAMGKLAR